MLIFLLHALFSPFVHMLFNLIFAFLLTLLSFWDLFFGSKLFYLDYHLFYCHWQIWIFNIRALGHINSKQSWNYSFTLARKEDIFRTISTFNWSLNPITKHSSFICIFKILVLC
jgi:hypothetical protein